MSEVKYSKKQQIIGILTIFSAAWVFQFFYNIYLQPKGMYVTFLEVVGIFSVFMMILSLIKSE